MFYVLQLERQCLLAGEPHGEERETIAGHIEGTIGLTVLGIDEGGLPKIRDTHGGEVFDFIDDMLVAFPEVCRHVPAIGDRSAVLDGDDGCDCSSGPTSHI